MPIWLNCLLASGRPIRLTDWRKFIKYTFAIEMQMKFHLTFEKDEDGKCVAECTDLPGCLSEGDTIEEAMENISEAIIGCLKSRFKIAG